MEILAAVTLIDRVCEAHVGNRLDHVKIQEAMNKIKSVLFPVPVEVKEEKQKIAAVNKGSKGV